MWPIKDLYCGYNLPNYNKQLKTPLKDQVHLRLYHLKTLMVPQIHENAKMHFMKVCQYRFYLVAKCLFGCRGKIILNET